MDAKALFEAGQLNEAIKVISDEIKKKPMDVNKRGFLCELLLIAREWDRADKQLDFIAHQNPDSVMTVASWRQLIRASMAREEFFTQGRAPDVIEEPDELVQLYLKASLLMREGNKTEANTLLEQAEEMRPKLHGTINGEAFDDLRDLDDTCPGVFEVLTSNGKYYWIPAKRVVCMEFHPPQSPIDLVLRRVSIQTNQDGPEGDVYMPAIYFPINEEDRENILLGRSTDWMGEEGEPVLGTGLRMFYANDEATTIMQIQEIEFEQ
ncbi:MAG: type VI secretion system accessory protein TagJ [Gammaproteobacteria bacterium]|nr:type VI secretion system accessory protein TagJ [Gammaproteobacteria bacterium]